jgi:hypothetical protein
MVVLATSPTLRMLSLVAAVEALGEMVAMGEAPAAAVVAQFFLGELAVTGVRVELAATCAAAMAGTWAMTAMLDNALEAGAEGRRPTQPSFRAPPTTVPVALMAEEAEAATMVVAAAALGEVVEQWEAAPP